MKENSNQPIIKVLISNLKNQVSFSCMVSDATDSDFIVYWSNVKRDIQNNLSETDKEIFIKECYEIDG